MTNVLSTLIEGLQKQLSTQQGIYTFSFEIALGALIAGGIYWCWPKPGANEREATTISKWISLAPIDRDCKLAVIIGTNPGILKQNPNMLHGMGAGKFTFIVARVFDVSPRAMESLVKFVLKKAHSR
eukprot:122819_1